MEEREPEELKFINILLDTLLIIGAVACVLTIDRGRWITASPAFYQPANTIMMDPSLMVNTGSYSAAETDFGIIPQTGRSSLKEESVVEWHESYNALSQSLCIDHLQARK